MDNDLSLFENQIYEFYIRAANHVQQQLGEQVCYKSIAERSSQARKILELGLTETQRDLVEAYYETEAELNAEFSQALYLQGMRCGAQLADFLQPLDHQKSIK